MTKVFLLKNQTVPKDPYYDIFASSTEYDPLFIPLLNHRQINEQETIELLTSNYFLQESKAFIITSQRAVESLASTLSHIKDDYRQQIFQKLAYTVGPATTKILQELGFQNIKGGADAGNGDILSDIILQDLSKDDAVVFFTGETRRDIIPKKLSNNGVDIREIVIYKTEEKNGVIEDFLTNFKETKHDPLTWIIFFSPQGTKDIVSHLKSYDFGDNVKIGSIGPTTEKYLIENNINVDLVSVKPDADNLFKGMIEHK